jgi:hypothetical protein
MARGFQGEQSQQASHNHQARPLRISLPTKRDSLTRRKTSQPTIRKRPTEEASNLCRSSLLSTSKPRTSQWYPNKARQRGHPSREGKPSHYKPHSSKPRGKQAPQEWSAYWVTYNPPGVRSLSALPPYSRKPGLYGPTMSVCAKAMSRGVHNIAFSLSPDGFWASDLGNEPKSGLVTSQGLTGPSCGCKGGHKSRPKNQKSGGNLLASR